MHLKFFAYLLLLSSGLLVLNSCNDEAEQPALELVIGNESYDLKNANLYLIRETVTYTWNERTYVISDGDLSEGKSGLSPSDFTNSTYFFQFQIGIPQPSEVGPGQYPQAPSWANANAASNVAYVYLLDNVTEVAYETNSSNNDSSPVVVGGNLDAAGTMTMKFSGKLSDSDGTNGLSTKLYFKGTVH